MSCIRDALAIETTTSAGSSDTDMKPFAVMPWTRSSRRVETIVTPVANVPNASRKRRCSVSGAAIVVTGGLRERVAGKPHQRAAEARQRVAASEHHVHRGGVRVAPQVLHRR